MKMVTSFNKADLMKFAKQMRNQDEVTHKDVNRFVGGLNREEFQYKIELNDRTLFYHNSTRLDSSTKFPFIQRFKHLLGAPVKINAEIFCDQNGKALDVRVRGMHVRIFPVVCNNGKLHEIETSIIF